MGYFGKRVLDVFVAAWGCMIWMALHPVLTWLIKRDSPGPVFYRQERLGRNGIPFVICKYRTMIVDAEADGEPRWW